MRVPTTSRALWILAAIVLLLTVAFLYNTSDAGGLCKSGPCTYYSVDGKALPGTCGASAKDDTRCACTANEDKTLSQPQLICAKNP